MKSKALITILASALFLLSFTASATPVPLKKEEIKKQIETELIKSTLDWNQRMTADVRICFSIAESGDIHIYKVLTENELLQKHITRSLGDMSFDDVDSNPSEYYWVTVRYQII